MILGIGYEDPFLVGLIGVGLLLVFVFLGVRVVFAAAIVGLLGLVELNGWAAGAGIAGTVPHSKSSAYALSVLPMFILIGGGDSFCDRRFCRGIGRFDGDSGRVFPGRDPGHAQIWL